MKTLAGFSLVLASAALVACGGSSSNPVSNPDTTIVSGSIVRFEADPNGELAYTTDKVVAKAGKMTIAFKNPQALGHVVKFEDSTGKTAVETSLIRDGTTSLPAALGRGTYAFYCSVPGHRKAGMEGTLVLR